MILRDFLLRAPLLPLAALDSASLPETPLVELATRLGSPDLWSSLHAAKPSPDALRAASRYTRRAAFRPTPNSLWAGVAVGHLGDKTAIATGPASPRLGLSWARAAALGRALLDDPDARARVRLRHAPSLLRDRGHVTWLDRRGEALAAPVDELLEAALAATASWIPWRKLAARLRKLEPDGDLDDTLLTLVDDGLLHTDVEPPLVGPAPLDWALAALPELAPRLRPVAAALAAGDPRAASEALAALPDSPGPAIHAVLAFPRAKVTLDRAAVERAAALVPLLVRLQEALAPPAAERDLDPALHEALDAVVEQFGAGAYELPALASGGYGVTLGGPGERPPVAVPPALLTLLVDAIATGSGEVHLDPDALDAVLPPAELPRSVELFLTPRREPAGAPSGSGWLLGLHAPAGASWGRFAHALGAPLERALAALAAADPDAVDVGYAPRADLADLAAHPPVRPRALAISSWSAGAITPADLRLAVDPGGAGLALVDREGTPVTPSPLARLRSTTAPPGVFQLLTGWSLQRQHAPWAVHLGPLAGLARLPRLVIDGFVVAPMSWRVPPEVAAGDAGALAAWRREARVPRHVQVGHEDELLPVDLDDAGAPRDLAGATRAWEIWPPLHEPPVDADGRRVEAVIAVVDEAERPRPRHVAAVSPVPRASDWRTFAIHGARDRQDAVLAGAVAPMVAAARAAGEIDAWFFQRYVVGARHHLRVRAHGDPRAFGERLEDALVPARAAGDVVALEIGEYLGEAARFGGSRELAAVEKIFEAESDLAVALLAEADLHEDPDELLVRALDALARGFGLDGPARLALAGRRRAAEPTVFPDDYRVRQQRLMAALNDTDADRLFAGYVRAVGRAARRLDRDAVLPILLHLCAVRLVGPDRDREAHAYHLWQRARDSLAARARATPGTPSPRGSRSPRGRT